MCRLAKRGDLRLVLVLQDPNLRVKDALKLPGRGWWTTYGAFEHYITRSVAGTHACIPTNLGTGSTLAASALPNMEPKLFRKNSFMTTASMWTSCPEG